MSLVFPYIWASGRKIMTWTDGTDDEIQAMINAADAGLINLADYWSVGDKRRIDTSYFVSEGNRTYPAQTMEAVLVQEGLYKDVNDKPVNFIVGFDNLFLNNNQFVNELLVRSNNTERTSWSDEQARTTCNGPLYNALPQYLQNIIKTVKVTTGAVGSTNIITEDKIFLAAEKEMFGVKTYSNDDEAAALTQFEYYTVTANRGKGRLGINDTYGYWLRSPAEIIYNCSVGGAPVSNAPYRQPYQYVAAPFCPHFCI